jgi:SAM-dependent methyltransferase
MLLSTICRQAHIDGPVHKRWMDEMGYSTEYHRKFWEYGYIAQALFERGMLAEGKRGLGFAVGQEPLPALFARYGCEVVATDMDAEGAGQWATSGQHAAGLDALSKPRICPEDVFRRRVSFRVADMNAVPNDLAGFDFVWSSCAIEHVGSLDLAKAAVRRMMRCLKPGGVAVHTTEFNILSNHSTLESGWCVLWRRRDLEWLRDALAADGHALADLDLVPGTGLADHIVDLPPYDGSVHLLLKLDRYVCTSVALIIEANARDRLAA